MNNNLDLGSLILQLISLDILFKDFNNSDLMNELQNQDEKYLKQILKNQEEILKILNEGRKNNGK
jgi:hypothetical protein